MALPAQSQVRCDRGSPGHQGLDGDEHRRDALGWVSRQGRSTYCKTQQREEAREAERRGKATQKDQCTSTLGPGSTIVSDSLPFLHYEYSEISQPPSPLIH